MCVWKNSDAKSNSREDDGRKEQKIIISSIQVASNTKVMRAKVFLPNVKSLEGTNYWLGGLDTTSKVDVIDTGDGIQINVCGFYSDDTAWKNPKVYKGFQSPDNSNTPLKNVLVKGKVVPMKEKMLKADVKKTKKQSLLKLHLIRLVFVPSMTGEKRVFLSCSCNNKRRKAIFHRRVTSYR